MMAAPRGGRVEVAGVRSVQRLCVVGGQRLSGTVAAAGAKNGVLPILSACLLPAELVSRIRVP